MMTSISNSIPLWGRLFLALVPALGATFAAVGLWLNAAQSRRTNAQARSAIVAKFLERFTDDDDMQSIFYDIEYSNFKYDEAAFHNSPQEKQLDKLLMHFSNAALAWRAGLLKTEDLESLQYLIRRILRNNDVQRYLDFVEEWSSKADLGEHPYIALSAMGKKFDQ